MHTGVEWNLKSVWAFNYPQDNGAKVTQFNYGPPHHNDDDQDDGYAIAKDDDDVDDGDVHVAPLIDTPETH